MSTKTLSIRLHENMIEALKQEARVLSAKQERDITYNDLITDAIWFKYSKLLKSGGENEDAKNAKANA